MVAVISAVSIFVRLFPRSVQSTVLTLSPITIYVFCTLLLYCIVVTSTDRFNVHGATLLIANATPCTLHSMQKSAHCECASARKAFAKTCILRYLCAQQSIVHCIAFAYHPHPRVQPARAEEDAQSSEAQQQQQHSCLCSFIMTGSIYTALHSDWSLCYVIKTRTALNT